MKTSFWATTIGSFLGTILAILIFGRQYQEPQSQKKKPEKTYSVLQISNQKPTPEEVERQTEIYYDLVVAEKTDDETEDGSGGIRRRVKVRWPNKPERIPKQIRLIEEIRAEVVD